MKKEPIRHHYIPQFILRNFCDEKGFLNYCEKKTNKIMLRKPQDIFMGVNMYRDEINHVENPVKIETDLARFENEVSKIIKEKFLVGNKVIITREEDEKLKLFFAIMGFRSHNTQYMFSEGISPESVDMYSQYQGDGNFQDTWKRNLGYLVNCRSLEEILNHKQIDDPIKIFMMRDIFGITGLYFCIVEKREGTGFVIGDTYPTVVTGLDEHGLLQIHIYSINPISPNRVILLVSNGAEGTSADVLGFRRCVVYKPKMDFEEGVIIIHVKKLYPEEVQEINRNIVEVAKVGFVFPEAQTEETKDLLD